MTRDTVAEWRYVWPLVRFLQRRADPDRAAAACDAVVARGAGDLRGRYFDALTPRPTPAEVMDHTLQSRVVDLGRALVAAFA